MPIWQRFQQRFTYTSSEPDSFPTRQLFVLALCRICEPIAFMSLFPYSYRMIESFHVTQDEDRIAMYSGMLITAFAFAEFSTSMIWGRISDRIGRKRVLVMGLVGTAVSMTCFGFATNLWTAVIARALGGLLNGNVGVLQTTVAELVKKKEHQPRAYSIMPFVWCLGSIIGPAMGGALAMPCEAYPTIFHKGTIFDKYPFLLPNLVCVIVLLFGIVTGILFIEETHPILKNKPDRGCEFGQRVLEKVFGSNAARYEPVLYLDEKQKMVTDSPPPSYQSTESSPRLNSTPASSIQFDPEAVNEKLNNGFNSSFNRQVVYIIIGYGILAFHSVSYDSLMPVMLSEPLSTTSVELPFKFLGGFGLSTKTIGFMLAVQGVYSMLAQLWLFPAIVKKLGTLNAFRLVMVIWPLLYLAVPYIVLLPQKLQTVGIYGALLIKITFHVIAFPANAILLANAAPSKSVLGTINGVAASTACLCRAFGPTISGSIHSAGLRLGYNGFAWWAAGIVCAVGALEAFCIQDVESNTETNPCSDYDTTTSATTIENQDDKEDSDLVIEDLDLNHDVQDRRQ